MRATLAKRGLALALIPLCVGCGAPASQPDGAVAPTLQFIGEQRLPHRMAFRQTTVGGLSGLDYDARTDRWVVISDDRSAINPARFYTARLRYDASAFKSVELLDSTVLRQKDGEPYPGVKQYAASGGEVPDFEDIRVDPVDGSIWFVSEGDVARRLNPFLKHASLDGRHLQRLPTSPLFDVAATAGRGPRDNLTFEGLSFAADGQSLWVAMEAPLVQDGPVPTGSHGAVARLAQYDRDGRELHQVAYPVDAIPVMPPEPDRADNGVSALLAVDEQRLLVVERAAVKLGDHYNNYIRLYEIDLHGATDIRAFDSLAGAGNPTGKLPASSPASPAYQPVKKRLLLDLNTLALPKLDNIEGIAWGPRLPDGRDSLVLVSDDNFNPQQVTQFLAFAVARGYRPAATPR